LKNQTEAVFPITGLKHYSSLAISEDGKMLIGQESDYTEDEFVTMDFDVRHPELIDTVVFGGIDNLRLRGRIRGMINDHQYLVQNMMGSGEGEVMNMYRIWDAETNSIDTFRINHPEEYYISLPALFLPPCEPKQLLSFAAHNDSEDEVLLKVNMDSQTIQEICENELIPNFSGIAPAFVFTGVSTPTDFRQSPLRIHLDDDQS